MSDRATKVRIPPRLPADFFEEIRRYDDRLMRRYRLDTNTIPPVYELNPQVLKSPGEAEQLSLILQKAYEEAYTGNNTQYASLLAPGKLNKSACYSVCIWLGLFYYMISL